MNKRLQIAYLTASDPLDKRSWSGIHNTIYRILERDLGDITALGPYQPSLTLNKGKVFSLLSRKLTGKRFDYLHSVQLAEKYADYFSSKLKRNHFDLVFAVAASTELAFLETTIPVFYVADASFANMIDYYPYYTSLSKKSIEEGHRIQQKALAQCRHLFFPSDWAANSAHADYGISREKISVFPFGPVIEEIPREQDLLTEGNEDKIQLLFLGVEWERKGGPVAVETMKLLRERGLNAELLIIGSNPEISHEHIRIIPFLNKNNVNERKELNLHLRNSDFLLVPTKAECYGLVFCEAASWGVPSISYNTGGVSGAVKNGQSGILLDTNCNASDFADTISKLVADKKSNIALRKSSRQTFQQELNWNKWSENVSAIVRATIKS